MSSSRTLTTSLSVGLPPGQAFETVVSELADGLSRTGTTLELGVRGRVVQGGEEIGTVSAWEPGKRIALEWHPATWRREERATVELLFDAVPDGSRVTFAVQGWGGLFADDAADLAGWFGGGVLGTLLYAISPIGVGDWLTDRRVRRPTGAIAVTTYADPTFHWPNFLLILERIHLGPDDNLLEVGCGGGAFMRKALESDCHATAIDHSPEMVALTIAQNRHAVATGSLTVLTAEADDLPVPDASFSCAVMTGVIGFLPDPVAALKEIHRALRPGGRLAVFGGTPSLRGTPAAPEPFASRIRFFNRAEFERIARRAGFVDVRVEEPALEAYARAAGLAEDAVTFFRRVGGALLMTGSREG